MKKSHFNNFLGRKNQSLFDTNIEIKEMDNVELNLDGVQIPESGTAKVRARPTVKHFSSNAYSSDITQGFAVPTPTVPVLSSFKGPSTNGTGMKLHNGLSIAEEVEKDVFIPPPPSMAPPPPPPQFLIPPPPDFSFDSSLQYDNPASLQPPPMPPPKPPSKAPSPQCSWEPDPISLKPPPMAPPKPPSGPSPYQVPGQISTSLTNGPEGPRFAPPNPPLQTTPSKSNKVPPPKPTRLSSITLDYSPLSPAPTPPGSASTPSTFNPQNTAKLYNVPQAGILSMEPEVEKPSRPILFLQDNPNGPLPVQVDGKMPYDNKDLGSAKAQVAPVKPARRNSGGLQLEKDLQDLKENLQSTLPTSAVKVQDDRAVTPQPLQMPQLLNNPSPQLSPIASALHERTPPGSPYSNSPSRNRKLIPHVSRTPYYRVPESSTPGTASPLALLKAAKERDKYKSSLTREDSGRSNSEPTTASIHQSQPNSFTVVPRPPSSLSHGGRESPDPLHRLSMENGSRSASPSRPLSSSSLVAELLDKHDSEEAPPIGPAATSVREVKYQEAKVKREEPKEDIGLPFIPPPPEFANSDTEDEGTLEQIEPPPSFPPPDPPSQKLLQKFPSPNPILAAPPSPSMVPPPPPKPKGAKPPSPPQLPVQKAEVKHKPPSQDKLKPQSPLPPGQALSPSQATLLSILQKKMLEMDQRHSFHEVNPNSDDWNSAEETTIPLRPAPVLKPKSTSTLPRQSQGLDMSELERKVAKKAQDSIATKSATSNGSQSKQSYGMTFTVRPGTKQPITPVIKGDTP